VSDYQSKKVRSPSYPGIGLAAAIERAEQLYERENRYAAPVPAVLSHWKYSPKSGPGFTTLAAVKQFGLIADEGRGDDRKVRLSDLGLRIVQDRRPGSTDRQKAIREAALRPGVYSELWRSFGAGASDANLAYALVRQGFSEAAAQDVVRDYRATIAFAGLTDDASVELDEPELEENSGDEGERLEPGGGDYNEGNNGGAGGSGGTPGSQHRTGREMSDTVVYAVPVALGADVKIEGRFPLSEPEWNQFIAVLQAMKPALVTTTREVEAEED